MLEGHGLPGSALHDGGNMEIACQFVYRAILRVYVGSALVRRTPAR